MEEQQTTPAQPSVTPTPPRKFSRKKLILGLFVLLLLSGGVCSALAWRTTYLDNYLPASVKVFFGRGEEAGKGEEEPVPPVISSVKATKITETGATITWTTDVEATSQVEYGTTTSYGSQTTEDTTLVTSHSAALSGLTKGTPYHYRVKSESAEGALAISEDYTFTTEDPTKDWETYKSAKYSIKYPNDWYSYSYYDNWNKLTFTEFPKEHYRDSVLITTLSHFPDDDEDHIGLSIHYLPDATAKEQSVEVCRKLKNCSVEEVTINGLKGYELGGSEQRVGVFFLAHPDGTGTIQILPTGKDTSVITKAEGELMRKIVNTLTVP